MVEFQQRQPQEARTWAMLCHLSTFAKYLAIPFGNIIGPLILWVLKKDQHPLVDDQGKEAINFQITVTLLYAVAVTLALLLIGFLMLIPIAVFDFVFTIIAAVKANEGVAYRYPFTLRLIR
jgi:uncharacterized Tic20 family protein